MLPGGATPDILRALDRRMDARAVLDFPVRQPTPAAQPPSIRSIRQLTAADVALVPATGERGGIAGFAQAPTNAIQRLKMRHHEIARRMAVGQPDIEIARALEMAPVTLTQLRRAPMFQALLASFMEARDREVLDFRAQMAAAAKIGLDRLTDALLEDETLTPGFVRDTTNGLLDRLGYSPLQRTSNVNVGLDARDIRSLHSRERFAVLNGEAVHEVEEASQRGVLGGADGRRAIPAPEASEDGQASGLALGEEALAEGGSAGEGRLLRPEADDPDGPVDTLVGGVE